MPDPARVRQSPPSRPPLSELGLPRLKRLPRNSRNRYLGNLNNPSILVQNPDAARRAVMRASGNHRHPARRHSRAPNASFPRKRESRVMPDPARVRPPPPLSELGLPRLKRLPRNSRNRCLGNLNNPSILVQNPDAARRAVMRASGNHRHPTRRHSRAPNASFPRKRESRVCAAPARVRTPCLHPQPVIPA